MSPKTTPKADRAATGRPAANARRPRGSVAARATTDFLSQSRSSLHQAAIGTRNAGWHDGSHSPNAKELRQCRSSSEPRDEPGLRCRVGRCSRTLSAELEIETDFEDVDVGFDVEHGRSD